MAKRKDHAPAAPPRARRKTTPTPGELGPTRLPFDPIPEAQLALLDNKSQCDAIVQEHVVIRNARVSPPRIPLCRLMAMAAVRPLQTDAVEVLKEAFLDCGYISNHVPFYLSISNADGQTAAVADFRDGWDPIWRALDDQFDKDCDAVEDFHVLKDKMFWVFDGNHRLTAWSDLASQFPADMQYHPCVSFVLLDPDKLSFPRIEQAMHALNRVTATCVPRTWLSYADLVYKHLTTPLSYYKGLMTDPVYANFERARSHGQGSSWYSHNMTMDAAVYIMSWTDIRSKEIDLSRRIAEDRKKGRIWTDAEKSEEMETLTASACAVWKAKMPKFISVLNPANGPHFLDRCRSIFRSLQRRKKGDGPMIGLDRVRVFAGAALTAKRRCELLAAHYGSEELKKSFHHPTVNKETSIRLWLQRWSMWCFIDHVGSLLIEEFASQVFRDNLHGDFSRGREEFVDLHKQLYKNYVSERAMSLGGTIWTTDEHRMKGLRGLWRARTKRVVVRFLAYLEEIRAESRFGKFPGAVTCWMLGAGPFSMYPCQYDAPQGGCMSSWERLACPWYMEYLDWNKYDGGTERQAALDLRGGIEPRLEWSGKILDPDESGAKFLEETILRVDPIYDGKKARRETEKDDKITPGSTTSDVRQKQTSSAAGSVRGRPPNRGDEQQGGGGAEAGGGEEGKEDEAEEAANGGPTTSEIGPRQTSADAGFVEGNPSNEEDGRRGEFRVEDAGEAPDGGDGPSKQGRTGRGLEESMGKHAGRTEATEHGIEDMSMGKDDAPNGEDGTQREALQLEGGDSPEIDGVTRKTTCSHSLRYRHTQAFGYDELLRFSARQPDEEPPIQRQFIDWFGKLEQANVRPDCVVPRSRWGAGRTGADLFVALMGTNTSATWEMEIPPWNVFRSDHLPHIQTVASAVLHRHGVLVVVHGGGIHSSMRIYECFRGNGIHRWADPETFTIWNETGRYLRPDTKLHEYSHMEVFRFAGCSERLPRDEESLPIDSHMNMRTRSVIYNYTKAKGAPNDGYSGTLSAAALQTIMEYTTKPGDVIVTFDAQFGAIYEAAENCGRMVFGAERWDHFGDAPRRRATELVVRGRADRNRRAIIDDPGPSALQHKAPPRFDEIVHRVFYADGNKDEVLVTIPEHPLTRKSLACLKPGQWLRDDVLDAYMALLQSRADATEVKLKFFPTHFYHIISTKGYTVSTGKGYAKDPNMSQRDRLFIPVNVGGCHWAMVLVDLKGRRLEFYDPNPFPEEGDTCKEMEIVARFFHDLADVRNDVATLGMPSWTRARMGDIPVQPDSFNCGVYVLLYAELISRPTSIIIDARTLPFMRQRIAVDLVAQEIVRQF